MQTFKIENSLVIVVFGLLLSSCAPTTVSNSLNKVQPILAQSESQFSVASNDTVEAQNAL